MANHQLQVTINDHPWVLNTDIDAPTGESPRSCAFALVHMVGAMWDPFYHDDMKAELLARGRDAASWIHAYGLRVLERCISCDGPVTQPDIDANNDEFPDFGHVCIKCMQHARGFVAEFLQ